MPWRRRSPTGRTVPSFRLAVEAEVSTWKEFEEQLEKKQRKQFDEMLDSARLYVSASSMATRTSKFEGIAIALMLDHFKWLKKVGEEAEQLRSEIGLERRE